MYITSPPLVSCALILLVDAPLAVADDAGELLTEYELLPPEEPPLLPDDDDEVPALPDVLFVLPSDVLPDDELPELPPDVPLPDEVLVLVPEDELPDVPPDNDVLLFPVEFHVLSGEPVGITVSSGTGVVVTGTGVGITAGAIVAIGIGVGSGCFILSFTK